MSRRSFVVLLALFPSLAACGEVAKIAGLPTHEVATVTVTLPATILSGDTVQAIAIARAEGGKLPFGDTTVTWQSSDPSAVSVDAIGHVTGSVVGAHATISATVQKKTGSAQVAIIDDQRLGYALADQPTVAGPYVPDANYRFNSSGGTIQVTRASTGIYSVRFIGLGRPGHDNVQVTTYAPVNGSFCNLADWQSTGSDLVADVRCFTAAGVPTDNRFTILLSGARPYVYPSRFGFVLTPDFAGARTAMVMDTFVTSRNSRTGRVTVGRNAVGDYSLVFPGLERVIGGTPDVSGPEIELITALGSGPERCRLSAVVGTAASAGVACTVTGGVAADSRFSFMWFTRGRPAPTYRFAYALADQANSTVDYVVTSTFARNNQGGTITARETAIGQYRVVFSLLGKTAGATETVMVMPVAGVDHTCGVTSWGNTGTNDLAVTVACFDSNGAAVNGQFYVLVIQ